MQLMQMEQQQSATAASLASAGNTVTPAIARSVAKDIETGQQQQLANRQRMRGVASTYLRGSANASGGGKTKLGE